MNLEALSNARSLGLECIEIFIQRNQTSYVMGSSKQKEMWKFVAGMEMECSMYGKKFINDRYENPRVSFMYSLCPI